ncbi:hypothetical protein [Promicromonospora soli]
MENDIFLSVGSGLNREQERFYAGLRDILRARGLNPRTLGRTDYLPDNEPLDGISKVLDQCRGVIVLALERSHTEVLVDRPGTANERILRDVRLPTVWNQIEATMAYTKRLPLLVIVDERLSSEGLLEERYDWLVLRVPLDTAALADPHVNGVLTQWIANVQNHERLSTNEPAVAPAANRSAEELSVHEVLSTLTVPQAWSLAVAIVAAASALAGFSYWIGSAVVP